MGKVSQTTTVSAVKRKDTEKQKLTLKDRFNAVLKALRSRFDNIVKRFRSKSKKTKKTTKTQKQLERQQKIRGIIGIGLLFVVVSIAYSTYMTVLFVDGIAMVVALAPQVIFATVVLFIAFYKFYK